MAYLALARKYRPQRFADMIGQEHVTRTLENAIKADRVHHAYLFCGVRGLGKTTAARILAKALVCQHGPTPEPCNECFECKAVNEGRSIDVIEIDGASNNSVDDIRSLRDQVNYLPQTARRKIYIIDEVHMLTQAAFNALLKTLEEPPPHVTFMFATTDPHKVLPTILSRVSRLDYRRVRAATLIPYLEKILEQEGFAVEPEGLAVVARCGDGSVRDSLTLLDKVIAFAEDPKAIKTAEVLNVLGQAGRFAVAELVDAVLARDAVQVLARFEAMTSTGSDLMQLAIAILQHLRDLAVVKLTSSREALLDMSDDLYEHLCQQAEVVEATVVAQHFDRFSRVIESLENSRVPRLVIEMGLLELCNAEPLLPLGDLVARLDALAGGRGHGGGGEPGGGFGRRAPGRGERPGMRAEAQPSAPAISVARAPTPAAAPTPAPAPTPVISQPVASQSVTSQPVTSQSVDSQPQPTPHDDRSAEVDHFEKLAREAGLLPGGPVNGKSPARTEPPRREPEPPRHEPEPIRAEPPRREPEPPRREPEPIRAEPPRREPEPPPPAPAPASAEPSPTPASSFALTNEDLAPSPLPTDPEAGCPSSRCIPREAIPWRELDPWDAWESFLDHIPAENDLLAAVLPHLGLVRIEPGKIVLASPATGFAHTQLRENPELRVVFEQLSAHYFGEAMRLELVDAAPELPELPSLVLVDAERLRLHREATVHDAEHNPRIRSLLGAFSGQLLGIEPLGEPSLPPIGQRGLPGGLPG